MNKLIILRGVSGCGKTTLAQKIVKNGVINSTDNYFIVEGKYEFDPKKLGFYHKLNQEKTKEDMINGISPIIIDNTNLRAWEMKPYVVLADNYGYEIEIIEIEESMEELLKRQNQRKDKQISKEVLEKMLIKFKRNILLDEIRD